MPPHEQQNHHSRLKRPAGADLHSERISSGSNRSELQAAQSADITNFKADLRGREVTIVIPKSRGGSLDNGMEFKIHLEHSEGSPLCSVKIQYTDRDSGIVHTFWKRSDSKTFKLDPLDPMLTQTDAAKFFKESVKSSSNCPWVRDSEIAKAFSYAIARLSPLDYLEQHGKQEQTIFSSFSKGSNGEIADLSKYLNNPAHLGSAAQHTGNLNCLGFVRAMSLVMQSSSLLESGGAMGYLEAKDIFSSLKEDSRQLKGGAFECFDIRNQKLTDTIKDHLLNLTPGSYVFLTGDGKPGPTHIGIVLEPRNDTFLGIHSNVCRIAHVIGEKLFIDQIRDVDGWMGRPGWKIEGLVTPSNGRAMYPGGIQNIHASMLDVACMQYQSGGPNTNVNLINVGYTLSQTRPELQGVSPDHIVNALVVLNPDRVTFDKGVYRIKGYLPLMMPRHWFSDVKLDACPDSVACEKSFCLDLLNYKPAKSKR